MRTIMAHLSKDGCSHIHYDDAQARTISVREAARLQSFPDGFIFSGAMNEASRASAGANLRRPTRRITAVAIVAAEIRPPVVARGPAALEKAIEA